MALLYRFAQLPDRCGSRVFSFVVTKTVVRDPDRDVTSKELVCGFQKWAVAFSRGDKVKIFKLKRKHYNDILYNYYKNSFYFLITLNRKKKKTFSRLINYVPKK